MTDTQTAALQAEIDRLDAHLAELGALADQLALEGAGAKSHIVQVEGISLKFSEGGGGYGNPRPTNVPNATRFTPAAAVSTAMRVKNGNGRMGQPILLRDAVLNAISDTESVRRQMAESIERSAREEAAAAITEASAPQPETTQEKPE
jgi:hypothetical protein